MQNPLPAWLCAGFALRGSKEIWRRLQKPLTYFSLAPLENVIMTESVENLMHPLHCYSWEISK
jgi:hypothetical protein